jgi:hypothetical protein
LGVKITGKISASGSVDIRGNVQVGGDINCGGKASIRFHEKGVANIGGKITPSGGTMIEGDVIFE